MELLTGKSSGDLVPVGVDLGVEFRQHNGEEFHVILGGDLAIEGKRSGSDPAVLGCSLDVGGLLGRHFDSWFGLWRIRSRTEDEMYRWLKDRGGAALGVTAE